MSASREKKARKGTQDEILNQQQADVTAKKSKTRKSLLIGIAAVLVAALLIGSIVLVNGPFFRKHTVAMKTGDHELSPVQLRFFYYDEFYEFYQSYGSMLTAIFPAGTQFDNQVFDEATGKTWGDVMLSNAEETIRTTYKFYDEAVKNGFELDEEGEAALEEARTTIEMSSIVMGTTADAYIRSIYGSGSDVDSYIDYQRVLLTASAYQQKVAADFTYSADEIQAEYEVNPADYHSYTYHAYLVNYDKPTDGSEMTEEEVAEALEGAKEKADKMVEESQGDLETFLNYCAEYAENETYKEGKLTLRTDYRTTSIDESTVEWITDPERQEGEVAALPYKEDGYYVVYFVGCNKNEYPTLNIRTIMVAPTTLDASGNASIDWTAADTQLEELKAELEAATDLSAAFDELAETYSADSATKTTGGLYKNVYNGTFAEDLVNEWLFEEGRAVGDFEIIKGTNGYYVLYVEEEAETYQECLVTAALRTDDYNAWYEEVAADATVEEVESGMKHLYRTIVVPQVNY